MTFDETLNDASGRGNNATYISANGLVVRPAAPTYLPGQINRAFQFHTAADASVIEFATLGYPDDLKFGTNTDHTVAFWVYDASNNSDSAIIGCQNWNSSRNVGWGIYAQGEGNFRVVTCNGAGTDQLDCCSGAASGVNAVRTTIANVIRDDAWHHLAVTTQRGGNRIVYLDGAEVNRAPVPTTLGNTLDTDEFSNGLGEPYAVNIGQDGTGAYTQSGAPEAYNPPPATAGGAEITAAIDDLGIWRRALAPTEVASIYNFGLLGTNLHDVPVVSTPVVVLFTPSIGASGVLPNVPTKAVIQDQTTELDPNSVQLFVDGVQVAHTLTKLGTTNTITYASAALFPPLTAHTNKLVFADTSRPIAERSTNVSVFRIAAWTNLYLGTPLYVETFDELTPAANPPTVYPSGWTVENCTDPAAGSGTWSLSSAASDAYLDWQIVPIDTIAESFNYGTRIRNVNGAIVLNGVVVPVLGSKNIAFAASDERAGNQVDYMFTRDYDLTSQSNIWVAFNSMYSQETYQLAALEYSIDEGAAWLPIVYMLDAPTVVVTNAVIDPYATLTTVDLHIPYCNGGGYGNYYGAFIGASTNLWGTLGPYISARTADDHVTSHRVERHRLPMADGQAKVRFRFALVGANYWAWGLDDFGIYSLAPSPAPLLITNIVRSSGDITLYWNGTGSNFSGLQETTNLVAPDWADIPGTIGQTNYTTVLSGAPRFFRAKKF